MSVVSKRRYSQLESGKETDREEDGHPPPFKKTCTDNEGQGRMLCSVRDKSDSEKPAELFRKDLISAMKLPDSEPLQPTDYMLITDPWRGEWERGVQVPVNPDKTSEAHMRILGKNDLCFVPYPGSFRLPKRMLKEAKDENFNEEVHKVHELQKKAEQVCQYDLDDMDIAWLKGYNALRTQQGHVELLMDEWLLELVLAEMEMQCHENMQDAMKTKDGLGIEFDESIMCDVCRTTEGEEDNEMVFCDGCDICVHQACYGINKVPEGRWLCRTCALGIRPQCIFCPKTGGAMKSTEDGSKWAHVSCVLWIPEVRMASADRMEPIINICEIPGSRWNLSCSLCHEHVGACIQCSVRSCKTAFHVTCGFDRALTMKTIFDEDLDDVILKAFCSKHSKQRDGDDASPRKISPRKEPMTEAEKRQARLQRMQKIQEEFYTFVKPAEIASKLKLDPASMELVYYYWSLKRKANFNKPLLPSRLESEMPLQENDVLYARIRMFVHLRQDLDRARNLCYMLTRREKLRRQLVTLKEELFEKEAKLCTQLAKGSPKKDKLETLARSYVQDCGVYDDHAFISKCNIDAVKRDDWPVIHITSAIVQPPAPSSVATPANPQQKVRETSTGNSERSDIDGSSTSSKRKKMIVSVQLDTPVVSSQNQDRLSMSTPLSTLHSKKDVIIHDKNAARHSVENKSVMPIAKQSVEDKTKVLFKDPLNKTLNKEIKTPKALHSKKEQMKKLSEYFKPSELLVSEEVKKCVVEKLGSKKSCNNELKKLPNGLIPTNGFERKTRDAVQQCLLSDDSNLPSDLSEVLRRVSASDSFKKSKNVQSVSCLSNGRISPTPSTSSSVSNTGLISENAKSLSESSDQKYNIRPCRNKYVFLNSLKRLSQTTLTSFCRLQESIKTSSKTEEQCMDQDQTIDVVSVDDTSAVQEELLSPERACNEIAVPSPVSHNSSPLAKTPSNTVTPKKNLYRRLFSENLSPRTSPSRTLRSNVGESPKCKSEQVAGH